MDKIGEENFEKTAERLGLDSKDMPRRIAVIMDGNGRWAQERGLRRLEGHSMGGRVVERIVLDCVALGIESLILYSFSIENWKRPKAEIDGLMYLYTQYLIGIRAMMMKNRVKLIHLGRAHDLPAELKQELLTSIEMTAENTGLVLGLALNYGGRSEIIDAAKAIAAEYKDGRICLDDIDEQCIASHLYTADFDDPDLLIRTANEKRISNFLLWQISYSEFYVTETYWPDFKKVDLEKAITDYASRVRRFGDIKI